MADSKRQAGTAGKATNANANATTNAKTAAPSAAELTKAEGSTVRITTTAPAQTFEGILFAVDASLGIAAVRDAQTKTTFHLATISQIGNWKILQPAQSGEDETLAMSKPDTEALKQREARAIADAKRAEANIGKGVTKEAQDLFDHLARTLPVRWAETRIIVSDSVIIDSPYGVENIKAPQGKNQALQQIRKVVDGYWNKKATGKSGTSTPVNGPPARAPVPTPRKGG